AALIVLADAHAGADRGVLDIRLGLTRHETQRRVKAGRVADREELLGIRAVAAAAHVRGGGEIDIDPSVARAAVAVAAFAGGQCFCGVESPHDSSFRRWCAAGPVRGRARSRAAGQRWIIAVGPAEAAVSSSTAGRSTLLSTSVTARSADRIRPSSAALAANRALRISWPISPCPPGFEGMNSTFDRPSWATFCMVSKYWVIISSCSAVLSMPTSLSLAYCSAMPLAIALRCEATP